VQEKVMPEEVELSNRVVREWVKGGQLSGDDFLRITFGDENGGQLFMGHGTSEGAEWWQHMKAVLRGGRHDRIGHPCHMCAGTAYKYPWHTLPLRTGILNTKPATCRPEYRR
jgi:hypothetical protein